ncbi:hypothetical protein E2C01_019804 [Portunus trituberculatus]|uniref:Uncharacterized protein n=1 Tax=Portunus trituberculatus TaxID=210409 RepID=A0A5B7E000_PORTR|nr:hypothetical protein [Portunus trituberculatus]
MQNGSAEKVMSVVRMRGLIAVKNYDLICVGRKISPRSADVLRKNEAKVISKTVVTLAGCRFIVPRLWSVITQTAWRRRNCHFTPYNFLSCFHSLSLPLRSGSEDSIASQRDGSFSYSRYHT